ncbi:unnamed protein product, partial [Hymenolepis diminuta]
MLKQVRQSGQLLRNYWLNGIRSHAIVRNLYNATRKYVNVKSAKFLNDKKKETKTESAEEQSTVGESEQTDNRSLFDPRYLAEVYREFYKELANAYAGLMNGFK